LETCEIITPEEVLKRYPDLCGRALLYRLLASRKFPGLIVMGTRYKISVRALEKVLDEGWIPNSPKEA
jgi:hypothetical protein